MTQRDGLVDWVEEMLRRIASKDEALARQRDAHAEDVAKLTSLRADLALERDRADEAVKYGNHLAGELRTAMERAREAEVERDDQRQRAEFLATEFDIQRHDYAMWQRALRFARTWKACAKGWRHIAQSSVNEAMDEGQRARAAEAKLAEVEAQAGVMRAALSKASASLIGLAPMHNPWTDVRGIQHDPCGVHAARDAAVTALAPDAGRRVLAVVEAARAWAKHRPSQCDHTPIDEPDCDACRDARLMAEVQLMGAIGALDGKASP